MTLFCKNGFPCGHSHCQIFRSHHNYCFHINCCILAVLSATVLLICDGCLTPRLEMNEYAHNKHDANHVKLRDASDSGTVQRNDTLESQNVLIKTCKWRWRPSCLVGDNGNPIIGNTLFLIVYFYSNFHPPEPLLKVNLKSLDRTAQAMQAFQEAEGYN